MFRLTAVLAVLAVVAAKNLHPREYYEEKFFNWMKEHSTNAYSGAHFVKMLQNFADNDDVIEQHNAGNTSYKLGHNQFSHLSLDEWREYVKLGLKRPDGPAPKTHNAPSDPSTLPAAVDWRTQGAVTPVKDQGQCGSCWSFSTTGSLEGAYFLKTGTLLSFSEQNLVDCDNVLRGGSDMGCHGGLMDNAFKWVQKNGGLCYEQDYPYTSGVTKKANDACDTSCNKNTAVAVTSYADVAQSDAALMSALAQQPVSVAIEADQKAFQLYKSGVFTASCGTNLDHGVLAVGYGTEDGADYYIVKNSWGTSWGDNGYIKLARGVAQTGGQCGILMGASYPTL